MKDLTSNDAFDAYVGAFGWLYDNGGTYLSQRWDWYSGNETGLCLLRQPPDRVAVVRFEGIIPIELWSGDVATSADFDQLMELLEQRRG